jgi:indolepyruvate ferredoxin oxidoreductase, beta subunit
MSAPVLKLLIAALGGEGGGVLADWLVSAARAQGWPVQATSIPGVAQRTGATTYYIEMQAAVQGTAAAPRFALSPLPGDLDVLVSSELLETGRMLERGLADGARTTIISSSARVLTTLEKMAMEDGRFDASRLAAAARDNAKQLFLHDYNALAQAHGTVISATLFGALAASGAWPLPRAACEAAIRAGGKGIEASVAGFAAAFDATQRILAMGGEGAAPSHAVKMPMEREKTSSGPGNAHSMGFFKEQAVSRLTRYQDAAYASTYVSWVDEIAQLAPEAPVVQAEFARELYRLMAFEDIAQVAREKATAVRYARVREEGQARDGEPVKVFEFFKPQPKEMADLLPPTLAHRVARISPSGWLGQRMARGLQLESSSIHGMLALRAMAAMRRFRRAGSRYAEEMRDIGVWRSAISADLPHDPARALEILLLARLVKGYSDTHARGKGNFLRILQGLASQPGKTAADIRAAREAALADPDGKTLDSALQTHGIAPRETKPVPMVFHRPRKAQA